MTRPVCGQPQRHVHEAVYFDTARQLVEDTAPLLRLALARGDDVALACADGNNEALIETVGRDDRILVLPRTEVYQGAVSAVAYLRDLAQERTGTGRRGLCILGEVGFGTDDRALDEWRRYEALLDHALSPFPLWSLCAYDTLNLPDRVLVTADLTHPFLRRNRRQTVNPNHVDPAELMRLVDADDDLIPEVEPALTIEEVLDFGELHRQLERLLLGEGMSRDAADDLVVAVHEVATNGVRHGRPPVTVRAWLSLGRVVCTVTDHGPGFDDPFAGYVRGAGETLPQGKFGLWLARQLCDEVVMSRTPDGFTVRVTLHH